MRALVGTIKRKSKASPEIGPRYYARIQTAVPGLIRWVMENGHVGDVCTVHHRVTGLWLGEIRVTLKGAVVASWSWEK